MTLSDAVADANPVNTLSAVIRFTVSSADSARMRFHPDGDAEQVTPYGLARSVTPGGVEQWEGQLLLDSQPASFYLMLLISSLYTYQQQ